MPTHHLLPHGRDPSRIAVRAGPQRGNLLALGAIAAVVVCAGWLAIDRWLRPSAPLPVPGIRVTTWKRVLDLPNLPDGRRQLRATVRKALKYVGPAPTDEQISEWRQSGACSALLEWLRPEVKERVESVVRDLVPVLDELADAADTATEEAKRRVRGSADELAVPAGPQSDEARLAVRHFTLSARAAGDLCVTDSYGGMIRHYRIRHTEYPRVAELRRQDADLNEIRLQRIGEEIAALLECEGRSVLDTGAMDAAWRELLAQARR